MHSLVLCTAFLSLHVSVSTAFLNSQLLLNHFEAGNARFASTQLRRMVPVDDLRKTRLQMSELDGALEPIVSSPSKRSIATLTRETEWKLSFSFTGPPIEGQFGPAVRVSCKCRFDEEPGYEPPQGSISIDDDSKYLTSSKAFWRLDEDPAAQGFDKAGFWVWGLFEEPKYPFFLFQMDLTQDIPLSSGIVPKGTIYGQAKISRDKEKGVVLTEGVVSLREPVKIKVDLLGLSDGILAEIQPCGTFACVPLP